MRDFETGLTRATLMEILSYDRETGHFVWLVAPAHSVKAGQRGGAVHPNGYRRIRIGSFLYLAHRLAWFYETGEWPLQVDHANRNPDDNRFCNLRVVPTIGHNQANRRRFKTNTSGYTGVYPAANGRWRARIEKDGRKRGLGTFDTKEAAAAAYSAAAVEQFGDFARVA